jgi:hypothetical protein
MLDSPEKASIKILIKPPYPVTRKMIHMKRFIPKDVLKNPGNQKLITGNADPLARGRYSRGNYFQASPIQICSKNGGIEKIKRWEF